MKYPAAMLSVLLGALAQYLFKTGVERLKFSGENLFLSGIKSIPLWCGIACYGVSLSVWFYVLSQMELSKAYPLVSFGYIITAILGYCFLNENLSLCKVWGILFILAGIALISKS